MLVYHYELLLITVYAQVEFYCYFQFIVNALVKKRKSLLEGISERFQQESISVYFKGIAYHLKLDLLVSVAPRNPHPDPFPPTPKI